jgi:hypothetical protein
MFKIQKPLAIMAATRKCTLSRRPIGRARGNLGTWARPRKGNEPARRPPLAAGLRLKLKEHMIRQPRYPSFDPRTEVYIKERARTHRANRSTIRKVSSKNRPPRRWVVQVNRQPQPADGRCCIAAQARKEGVAVILSQFSTGAVLPPKVWPIANIADLSVVFLAPTSPRLEMLSPPGGP